MLGRSKSIFGARRGQTSSLQRVPHVVGVRWKSQHRKKWCLSLLMSKNLKLKKVIKGFAPERISSVFGFLYAYEHCERFFYYIYEYFTYSYLAYITRRKFCEEKFFLEIFKSWYATKMSLWQNIFIRWIKIIFWYPSDFSWPFKDLCYRPSRLRQ